MKGISRCKTGFLVNAREKRKKEGRESERGRERVDIHHKMHTRKCICITRTNVTHDNEIETPEED